MKQIKSLMLLLLVLSITFLGQTSMINKVENPLIIPKCEKGFKVIPNFLTFDALNPKTHTSLKICYTPDNYFMFYYLAEDYYILNQHDQCNQPLYTQDVVELFIGNANLDNENRVYKYIELEISPSNEMFLARIENQDGTILNTTYIDCDTSGVTFKGEVLHNEWSATIKFPFSLVLGEKFTEAKFKGNFFRVDLFREYGCSGQTNCYYYCYNPTLKNPPSFHQPQFFVDIELEQ